MTFVKLLYVYDKKEFTTVENLVNYTYKTNPEKTIELAIANTFYRYRNKELDERWAAEFGIEKYHKEILTEFIEHLEEETYYTYKGHSELAKNLKKFGITWMSIWKEEEED